MKPISGKRMCRILEKHGWVLVRTKSSHRAYGIYLSADVEWSLSRYFLIPDFDFCSSPEIKSGS